MVFTLEYTKRKSKCALHGCSNEVSQGMLKICKILSKNRKNYHLECFFKDVAKSAPDADLSNLENDLANLKDVSQVDLLQFSLLLTDFNSQKGTRNLTTPITPNVASTSIVVNYNTTNNPCNNTIMGNIPGVLNQVIVVSDDEDDTPGVTVDMSTTLATNNVLRPNKRDSAENQSDQPPQKRQKSINSADDDETICSICLDVPVHAVKLPCSHMFCYLCAKGLILSRDPLSMNVKQALCSLCRQPFTADYLESKKVLQEAVANLNSTPPLGPDPTLNDDDRWQWFYQGNKGWWRFERRNNEDLEKSYLQGDQSAQMLICGKMYTLDFVRMEQYQTNFPQRKRKIKRDLRSSQCKGVAGLQVKSSNN